MASWCPLTERRQNGPLFLYLCKNICWRSQTNDADCPNVPRTLKPLCVQEHAGWLRTMVTNNHCCFFESTYLSFDYTVQQNKITKGGVCVHECRQRGAARIKNKPLGKHNNCPVQTMPLSHNLSAALQTQEPLASPIFMQLLCHWRGLRAF